ncbi:MAG: IMPACT family protein [Candidatus Poribacteria bacterium]|nr:IMPACT family protein [Candidatus Poribacteria bacterium]
MSGEYQTIVGIATAKHVVKKSRFFGEASAVNSHDAVKKFVADVRSRIRQATHYCYAYCIGSGNKKLEYATDAGEPIHSAGPPILTAIRATELSNTIIVVARYYGGTNLGIGGLIRAYGTCARACLKNATLETRTFYHNLHVSVPYSHIGAVVTLCKRLGGQVTNIEYDPTPNIAIQIQQKELKTFKAQLQSIGITKTELQ